MTSEEKLFAIKEEARIKYEQTGLMHSKCVKCGTLPINMFYLNKIKNKEHTHKPQKHCKKCTRKRNVSMHKKNRQKYWKRANAKRKLKKQQNPAFHKQLKDNAKIARNKSRETLDDKYIIKLICARGKMKAKDVQPWMIVQRRAEVLAHRENDQKVQARKLAGVKTTRKEGQTKNRKELARTYVRQVIRLTGVKSEDITPEMEEAKRQEILAHREKLKNQPKYASEAQKLTRNYLTLVASNKLKIPKNQVTDQQREETKQRILERRERLGFEAKSAEARIKFQMVKRKVKGRKPSE